MIVTLPVFFRATAVPPKARTPTTETFVTLRDYDIAEVSGDAAPVAASGFRKVRGRPVRADRL